MDTPTTPTWHVMHGKPERNKTPKTMVGKPTVSVLQYSASAEKTSQEPVEITAKELDEKVPREFIKRSWRFWRPA